MMSGIAVVGVDQNDRVPLQGVVLFLAQMIELCDPDENREGQIQLLKGLVRIKQGMLPAIEFDS